MRFGFLAQGLDCGADLWRLLLDCIPDDGVINHVVAVNKNVPETDNSRGL